MNLGIKRRDAESAEIRGAGEIVFLCVSLRSLRLCVEKILYEIAA